MISAGGGEIDGADGSYPPRKERISKNVNTPESEDHTLNRSNNRNSIPVPKDREKGFPLLQIKEQYYTFDDLIVKDELKERLQYIIAENLAIKRLKSYGIKPKQKLLFCGPPGTGKTLTAKIMSTAIGYPFVYVHFDSILSSYLGETATNLRKIFEFIEHGSWIVLFDEFDIIGKRRDDPHEHGEIKRVVNNLMQMIDNYEGNSVLIAATNHQKLLDTALWRRFDDILYFELPNAEQRVQLFEKYLRVMKRSKDISLRKLARQTPAFSGSDIAQVCQDALRRSIIFNKEDVTLKDIAFAINEQKRRKKIIKGSAIGTI